MPPNILTFDADSGFDLASVGPVKKVYRSLIALTELEPYGPLAMAAGIQWNREMVQGAGNFRTAGAMRAQAAQNSLPSPTDLNAILDGSRVRVTWKSIYGAVGYNVQLAKTADFTNKFESIVMQPQADLPRPEMAAQGDVYLRVRAMDNDLSGAWSNYVSLSAGALTNGTNGTAPQLTSPLDNAETDGFAVVLEWIAESGASYRIQISPSNSFEPTVVDQVVQSGEFAPPSAALKMEKTYYWRVRRWDANGSDWSSSKRFVVSEPQNLAHDAMINPEAPQ
jgi:hypothetical protein